MKCRYAALTLVLCLSLSGPLVAWEFAEDNEGWIPQNVGDLQVSDGVLTATIPPNTNDPYITGPFGPWDANDITGILLRTRVSTDVDLYSSPAGPAIYFWNPTHHSVGFALPAANQWSSVLVDMNEQVDWTGTIDFFRVDMPDQVPQEYTVEFDWIRYMDLYLHNESFELWDDVNKINEGWSVIGGDFNDLYEADVNVWNDPNSVFSLSWALQHLGNGSYHAIEQSIKGGLTFEQGTPVTLHGALKVPADTWDGNASIWFRIREFDGTTEILSAPIAVDVFDTWFEFESTLELAYSVDDRQALDVQLYAAISSGRTFLFDDIFVDVGEPNVSDADLYNPYVQSHWEFETVGDAEGWGPKPGEDIAFFDVNRVDPNSMPTGAMMVDLPGGSFDPYIGGPVGPYYGSEITGVATRMRYFNATEADIVKPGDGGQNTMYFFPVEGVPGTSPQFEIPGVKEWFIAYLDCSDRWSGWINNLRLDLNHAQDYTMIDVDWIRTYGQYISNNGFEESLDPWAPVGAGFSLSPDQVQTGQTALMIEGQGVGVFHAVEQRITGWDASIPKGATVTVRGSYYVPQASWAPDAALWLRVNELEAGTVNENLDPSAPIAEPIFDTWTPFEASIVTQHDPDKRGHLSVQLFSKTPAGTAIYVDDVFVEVIVMPEEAPTGWPVNCVQLADDQVITIDGVVSEGEYAGANALVINSDTITAEDPYAEGVLHQGVVAADMTETNQDDYSGTFNFMWDATYLYVALSATDDAVSPALGAPNGADCLQFVLGALEETDTTNMFIPTIAPDDGAGLAKAMNNFGGWLAPDLFAADSGTEFVASVDPDTQDWTVEVKIPWTALQTGLTAQTFPPAVGDQMGVSILGIDYDNGVLEWFSCIKEFPWTGAGLEAMTFVGQE